MAPHETPADAAHHDGDSLRPTAAAALAAYGLEGARITPLSARVHATFRADAPAAADGARYVLRIYGPGTYGEAAIRSELVWLEALRREEGLLVPEPVATRDGSWVSRVDGGDGAQRYAVLMRWLTGRIMDEVPEAHVYLRCGEFMARLHRHGSRFRVPPDFERPRYDLERIFGPPGAAVPADVDPAVMSAADRDALNEAAALLRPALAQLGEGRDVFCLIHGDLQITNQLFHRGEVGAIDFVDCGWGYCLFDIAGALAPAWEGHGAEERRAAFLRGYRRIRPLSRADEALLETFVLARAFHVLRWSLETWSDPAVREYSVTIVPHIKAQIERFLAQRSGGATARSATPVPELLASLRRRGIRLWAEDGRLRYKAPQGALDSALRARLREHKEEIVALLGHRPGETAAPAVARAPREGPLPASFAQQRMWILDRIDPGSPAYNIAQGVRLRGALRDALLRRSLGEIVRRHESLRTHFATVDGQPVQVINAAAPSTVPMVDLRSLAAPAREATARQLAGEEALRPFDLERGPLVRFTLLELDPGEHWLLLTLHHIISDGWSNGVLIRELTALYRAYCRGEPSPLEELSIQYADFAHWQRQWLRGAVLEAQLDYWRKQLAGAPSYLALPTDRPRPRLQSARGVELPLPLRPGLGEELEALSQRHQVTLFMTLEAALVALLCRHTGQRDIVIGSPIANRNRSEIEGLIGCFVNTLVLRTRVKAEVPFAQLLREVRAVTLGAYSHQDLPFEMLVEALEIERNPSYTPVFQVLFVLQNAPSPAIELPGLTLSMVDPPRTAAVFDLSLTIRQRPDGLEGALTYNADLFEATRIRRMLEHFQRLLAAVVASPETRVGELPLVSAAERQQLVAEWSDRPALPPAEVAIHELFASQAARTPAAVAVVDEGRELFEARAARAPEAVAVVGGRALSYGELDRRANALARRLVELGVGPETVVGLWVERSLGMLEGMLGILKAGGVYLPLDPATPRQRLVFMLEDSGARAVVAGDTDLTVTDLPVVALAEIAKAPGGARPGLRVDPDQGAYVIYTSGSTGRPKGVVVSHRSLAGYAARAAEAYGIGAADRVLQFASMSFDASAEEIYPTLIRGAALVLRGPELATAGEFLDDCRRAGITVVNLPTAYWHTLTAEAGEAGAWPGCVRLVIIGGEEALPEGLERWQRWVGDGVRLVNTYGPTEATIVATRWWCERAAAPLARVPIGRPVAGARAYVLDRRRELVPAGVPGELCLAGDGVARGYPQRPELTAERFLPDPFGAAGERLYATGDRVRWRDDGELEFLGRIDAQVKIRGFRVEPGEIEALLGRHPGVREAAVTAPEERLGIRRLVAYVVPREALAAAELREFLAATLPDYMVPAAFVVMEALPRTSSGKIDHRALPVPDPGQLHAEDEYVAPETPTEQELAEIWGQLLDLERVGIYDNFFDLGGHSLLATQLISRIRTRFQVELTLATFFGGPTVADVAKSVDMARRVIADAQRDRTAAEDEEREEGAL